MSGDRAEAEPDKEQKPEAQSKKEVKGERKEAELANERFGFVTGVVVVWGIALLKCYPLAVRFQLPEGAKWVTANGEINHSWYVFLYTLLALSMGATTLVLSVAHIVARGLLLTSSTTSEATSTDGKERLRTVCKVTFVGVFRLLAISLVYLSTGLIMYSILLVYGCLLDVLGVRITTFSLLLGYFVAVLLIACILVYAGGPRRWGLRAIQWLGRIVGVSSEGPKPSYFVPTFTFSLIVPVMYLITYTAEIEVSEDVVYRSENKMQEIRAVIGGRTSDPNKVVVTIVDPNGERKTLPAKPLGRGRIVAIVDPAARPLGLYSANLQYSGQWVLIPEYPFLTKHIRREEGFVIEE